MRYFFKFLFAFIIGIWCNQALAQNYPVYNSFYINPYLYNPAEALTDYTQIYALHRQQWMNVEGAPVMSTLSFTTMMNDSRAGCFHLLVESFHAALKRGGTPVIHREVDPVIHAVAGEDQIRLHFRKDPVQPLVQIWSRKFPVRMTRLR